MCRKWTLRSLCRHTAWLLPPSQRSFGHRPCLVAVMRACPAHWWSPIRWPRRASSVLLCRCGCNSFHCATARPFPPDIRTKFDIWRMPVVCRSSWARLGGVCGCWQCSNSLFVAIASPVCRLHLDFHPHPPPPVIGCLFSLSFVDLTGRRTLPRRAPDLSATTNSPSSRPSWRRCTSFLSEARRS
jgi:hypothetical protein